MAEEVTIGWSISGIIARTLFTWLWAGAIGFLGYYFWDEVRWLGWVLGIVGGLVGLVGLLMLSDIFKKRGSAVILGERGIEDRTGDGADVLIPWIEIQEVTARLMGSDGEFVVLDLKDADGNEREHRLSTLELAVGCQELGGMIVERLNESRGNPTP